MMKFLIFLLLSGFLCGGCFQSAPEKPEELSGMYEERLAGPRTVRQLEKKELLLAVLEGPRTEQEIAIARAAALKAGIVLKIVRVDRREVLSPMLRSGRADLIAGSFTVDEVRTLGLLPVLSRGREIRYCLAVRRNDFRLEERLGTVGEIPASGESPETVLKGEKDE